MPAGPPPVPVLVTRAAEDTERLVAALLREGVPALAAPCLAYAPEPVDLAWLAGESARPTTLLVTSPRSLPALLAAGLDRGLPAGWALHALAPATAAALRRAGIPVTVERSGGAADLARGAPPGALLYATSDLGGDEILAVRPDARPWRTYRTVCPDRLPAPAEAALAGVFEVVAASPSALHNLDALHPGAVARACRVLAHGRTTAAAAVALGARVVVPWRIGTPFPAAPDGAGPPRG